jgi:Cys-tRNA(Pro)/Cys-tRNA(Cys) deacylase
VARQAQAQATPATLALAAAGVAFAVRRYEHDPGAESFGLEAAQALAVDPARVLKTLLVSGELGLAVAIVPVDTRLDLKAMAAALGAKKVAMADPAQAERATGYVVGGISPVGQKRRLPTVLDETALRHRTVLVSAGRRGMELELTPTDLLAATGATAAPLTAQTGVSR